MQWCLVRTAWHDAWQMARVATDGRTATVMELCSARKARHDARQGWGQDSQTAMTTTRQSMWLLSGTSKDGDGEAHVT